MNKLTILLITLTACLLFLPMVSADNYTFYDNYSLTTAMNSETQAWGMQFQVRETLTLIGVQRAASSTPTHAILFNGTTGSNFVTFSINVTNDIFYFGNVTLYPNQSYIVLFSGNGGAYSGRRVGTAGTYPLVMINSSKQVNITNSAGRATATPTSGTVTVGYGDRYGLSAIVLGDISVPISNNVSITVNDFYTNTSLTNFTATATNSSGYQYNGSTTTGTLNNWTYSFLQNSTSLWNITLESTENGGYFNRTLLNQNVSSNIATTLAQSIVSFTATEYISNASLSGVSFATQYLTNDTHYMRAGTYTVNASKSGYFTKSENVTAVALTSSAVVIEDMTKTRLNVTVRNILNNATISNFTLYNNISSYSFSRVSSTTNGSIIADAINGNWTFLVDADGFALTSSNATLTDGTNNITLYVYTSESVNVTFRNELTNAVINTTTVSLELISDIAAYNYTTTNGYIYFDLVSPTSYLLRYQASGYSERFSYLEISSRSNQNLTLYLLPSNASTNVTLTVINENAQPVQNALVRILKYDLPTNSYIEREVKFTDFAGQMSFSIEYSSEFYKFFVEYPVGETVLTTEPAYISSTTLTLQINTRASIISLDNYLGITSDLTFNTATNNYRSEFSNSENLLSNVCLYVYRTDTTKTLYNTSCSELNSQSGTILISVLNTSGREYRADLYYNFSGDLYYVRSKTVSFAQGVDWGIWGLVIVTLLTIALVFMFKESLVIAVSVAPLPMLMGSLTGIILIPTWVSFGIEILALVLAYLISRYAQ